MPKTHDIGAFFVHPVNLKPGSPFLHTAPTDEIEPPYRRSDSLVVKYWPGKGLVLGFWRKTERTERQALLAATQGYEDAMSTDDIRENAHRFDADVDDALLT